MTISIGHHRPGDKLTIANKNAIAISYRLDFGEAGAVRFTVAPGAEFVVIVGAGWPQIHMEEVSEPGLRAC